MGWFLQVPHNGRVARVSSRDTSGSSRITSGGGNRADFAAGAEHDDAQLGDRIGQHGNFDGSDQCGGARARSPEGSLLSYRRISIGTDLLLHQQLGFRPQAGAGEVYFAAGSPMIVAGSVPPGVKWNSTPWANLPGCPNRTAGRTGPLPKLPVPRTRRAPRRRRRPVAQTMSVSGWVPEPPMNPWALSETQ